MSAKLLVRAALAAAVTIAFAAGCSDNDPIPGNQGGSRADSPIGVLKSSEGLMVFLGNQCGSAEYPSRITVTNYDPGTQAEKDPALWDVSSSKPDLLPSVVIGKVPGGYNVVSDHIADQGIGKTLRVQVVTKGAEAAVFDTSSLADGQLLDARGGVTTVNEFRSRWGCGN